MILTAIILLAGILALFWKSSPRTAADAGNAFDLPTTHILKGMCALVVVMVHFPQSMRNPLQDAVGSFAYIAVTFFFFVSAYGMEYSYHHRRDYLKRFWINRLTGLLIPMVLVNIVAALVASIDSSLGSPWQLLTSLNGYVRVLLYYCVAFYILHIIGRRFKIPGGTVDAMLILLIVATSLYQYFCQDKSEWPYERFGLAWGLLAYRYKDGILTRLKTGNLLFLIAGVLLSGILGAAYLKFKTVFFFGEYLLKIFLGLSVIVLLFAVASRWKFGNPVVRFLGDISYEIYLIHEVGMAIVAFAVPHAASGTAILLIYIVTLALSGVIHTQSTRLTSWAKALL